MMSKENEIISFSVKRVIIYNFFERMKFSKITHINEIKLERVQGGCLGIRSR